MTLGFDRPSLARSCLLLALTCPIGVVIHEGGHYVAGSAVGQFCRRFVIGPVELARGSRRWTIRLVPVRNAGLVDFVPSTFARFRRSRAICAAGGPLASLCTGVVFVWLSSRAGTGSGFWMWSFCAQWALVGLLGLVPFRRGTTSSDGYLLWELIRGGATVDAIERDLLTASSHATPLRLRDWPNDLIRRLADDPADPKARRYAVYLAYVHFLDRGEIQTAGQLLDRLMADWIASDPPEYALDAAYFFALYGHDLRTARTWLTRETRDAEPWVRLRAQAAVERLAGNQKSASAQVDEALTALQAAPACGAHQYEIDRLNALLRDGAP
ncbi:MAG TPA: site-2 protease family protein [Bryobacteraceae bacterium]|nr:site-2 protease family protein [Bryobacteraceae bacterium]